MNPQANSSVTDPEVAALSEQPQPPVVRSDRLTAVAGKVGASPWFKACTFVALALLIVVMPALAPDSASLLKLTTIAMWMSLGIFWNWVAGFAGRMDLAFGAYFAFGAYASAYLMTGPKWGFIPALLVGAVGAAILATAVAAAFLRLSGMSYAIATLCIYLAAEQIPPLLDVLGAGAGLYVPVYFQQDKLWYLFGGTALFGIAATIVIRRSQFGLALLATRDDALSADARGINVDLCQIVISAAMGLFVGVVGGLWSLQNGLVSPPTVFTTSLLLFVLVVVLIGGIGTIAGPIVGAVVFIEAGDFLWNRFLNLHDLILAVFLMVVALVAPYGLSKRTFVSATARWRTRREWRAEISGDETAAPGDEE